MTRPRVAARAATPRRQRSNRVKAVISAAYRGVVSPHVDGKIGEGGVLTKEPRVDRWVFSTDGVGFPVPKGTRIPGAAGKGCRLVAFPTETGYAVGSTGLIKAATRQLDLLRRVEYQRLRLAGHRVRPLTQLAGA